MSTDAIVARDLTYRYDKLTAVDHISFSVAEGEILSFLAPNGAGKTTAVRVAFVDQGQIAALDTPHNLKQRYGKRALIAQVARPDGKLESREIDLQEL